ncbi:cytochrome P450 78A3 [Neohortaea acidophila]|uniref:Cytochrome P450 78A3 n=1 Tax=Neohortaea acidophila TaxID=245834 RepID=A0A6A6PZX7_9PEZI|nr:cytochrome P450 78A3 [Neohortaea acidophila]KAF2485700.1 cytochrome P450 78A3 [Neohortaea acidophila]
MGEVQNGFLKRLVGIDALLLVIAINITLFLKSAIYIAIIKLILDVTYKILSTLWSVYVYPRFFSPLRHIPVAPGGSFLFGHTRQIIKAPSSKLQCEWVHNVPNDGFIRYSMFGTERLLLCNTRVLSEVLVTKAYDFVKPPGVRRGIGRTLGIGILLAEGDEHKVQRKNLMPAFAFRHVKDLYPTFWAKAKEMTDCLAEACKGSEHAPGAIEVGGWVSRATLDIIGLSGMGQDFNSLQDENNKLNQTYRTIFNQGEGGIVLQLAALVLPFWFITRLPLKINRQISDAATYVKQVCRELIAKKRASMAEKSRTDVDIISVALESGGFSDEDLVNQMMTFLVAGHETTATAMIWSMYLLCRHPEIQAKLRTELRAQLPSLDEPVTAADFDRCQYLKACTNEILRLWAPVGLTLRQADKDTSINGQFIPKGTVIIISPWAINTSTALWGPDAKEFKPERWLDADGKANNKGGAESNFAFLTFLHGPRSCIGQRFAQAEFECLLAGWLMRFDTKFEEGNPLARGEFDIKGGVTAKPKGGVWVMLDEIDA